MQCNTGMSMRSFARVQHLGNGQREAGEMPNRGRTVAASGSQRELEEVGRKETVQVKGRGQSHANGRVGIKSTVIISV